MISSYIDLLDSDRCSFLPETSDGIPVEPVLDIPDDLIIPKFHGPSVIKEFDDSSLLKFEPDDKGRLTAFFENGKGLRLNKPEHILLLFPNKYNWVYSKLNEFDCITKVLNKDQRGDLILYNQTSITYKDTQFTFRWIPGTYKATLTRGKDRKSTRYLLNAGSVTGKYFMLEDYFNDLRNLIEKIALVNKFSPYNPISFPGTARNYLLKTAGKEFKFINKLTIDDLRFIHSGYKGPRMETKSLGTMANRSNIDMNKAYAYALANTPGLDGNLAPVRHKKVFYEDSHPGSVYVIRVNVPQTYSEFTPLPFKASCIGSKYTHGEFIVRVAKPYIDLLNELGDIPYEILDSLQLVLIDPDYLPFKQPMEDLIEYEDSMKQELSPIILKLLHVFPVGCFLHHHQEIDPETAEITEVASSAYNPILSNAMQATVAAEMYKLAIMNNADAIRVDALTGKNLPVPPGFKDAGTGDMTWLTANFKDKPGETLYRNYIHADRDKPYTTFRYVRRQSFSNGYFENSTGRLFDASVNIKPSGNGRNIKPIGRIGELLEGEIKTSIQSIEKIRGEPSCRVNGDELDKFLRYTHQTQT